MTPKEKAKDLFDKMYNSGDLTTFASKNCALKAVDEIINEFYTHPIAKIYWQKVKHELKNIII
jgi:hypothetical protein